MFLSKNHQKIIARSKKHQKILAVVKNTKKFIARPGPKLVARPFMRITVVNIDLVGKNLPK